jgi:predicted unusual protein kinase regulating ubiquinone biosynthesis (AarF/ABC1/UbiB family)
VPPFATRTALAIVAEDLGKPTSEVFSRFEEEPIAAASIAQVHGATLLDGVEVVVKIQRPGIPQRIGPDMFFLRLGARLLTAVSERARLSNVVGIVNDFEETLHKELDFRTEAQNMDEFNDIMSKNGVDEVVAPRVHWDYTTRRVLVMQRFYGIKADDIEAARRLGIDSEYYLRVGMRAWMLSVLLRGFFHGDVHAGNLMLLTEERKVGFLDFGIIGRFTDERRKTVMRYILAFAAQDFGEVAKILVELGSVSSTVDTAAFASDIEAIYSPLFAKGLGEINYGEILPKITRVSLQYGVSLPQEFVLILKQLLYFDRYAKLAAPNLNVFSDIYLVNFLFTPAAAEAGIDIQQIMGFLMAVQARNAARIS